MLGANVMGGKTPSLSMGKQPGGDVWPCSSRLGWRVWYHHRVVDSYALSSALLGQHVPGQPNAPWVFCPSFMFYVYQCTRSSCYRTRVDRPHRALHQ